MIIPAISSDTMLAFRALNDKSDRCLESNFVTKLLSNLLLNLGLEIK